MHLAYLLGRKRKLIKFGTKAAWVLGSRSASNYCFREDLRASRRAAGECPNYANMNFFDGRTLREEFRKR